MKQWLGQSEFHHRLDREVLKTWVYPLNYQELIISRALHANMLVVLPTGLGKTFITAIIMYSLSHQNRTKKFSSKFCISMTYSEEERYTITTLRISKVPWKVIASTVGKTPAALRSWWQEQQKIIKMLLKPKISKLKTDGQIGLQIKSIIENTPNIPVHDIP
ncbi:3'-5' DNA helicase, partial [Nowakowskiella sp. JEL0078]